MLKQYSYTRWRLIEVLLHHQMFNSDLALSQATMLMTPPQLYMLLELVQTLITDCTFSENVAEVGNTISFLFADTTLENTTMQNNECSVDSCNIFVSFSTVSIVDSTMTTTSVPWRSHNNIFRSFRQLQ